ncbi:MAG: PHP domain-containing protein, partial [Actinobacteria bacterium]|nr:PHP domain-containing protein [Actinomycetota bacterium]
MLIDLHSHTHVSDGQDSPRELVEYAKEAGVAVLAITDHDTLNGWQQIQDSSDSSQSNRELTIVPGAEISCRTSSGMSVHMLGYLFDPHN